VKILLLYFRQLAKVNCKDQHCEIYAIQRILFYVDHEVTKTILAMIDSTHVGHELIEIVYIHT
jgi:hypothetical protein